MKREKARIIPIVINMSINNTDPTVYVEKLKTTIESYRGKKVDLIVIDKKTYDHYQRWGRTLKVNKNAPVDKPITFLGIPITYHNV